ncbi:MAG: ATP-grasp domain-containing protein [Treponema sp.]|nr:ATP-grasp domain-containing protein [Treponema sp.]
MENKQIKGRILILGAGIMQGPSIRIAKEMGLETVVVDGDPHAPCVSLADRFEPIDLKDKEGIEALARKLQAEGGLSGVMTAGTDFSSSVAWVAEKLGLPGIPYEVSLDASDKERMRRRFREAGVPSPNFLVIKDFDGKAPPKLPFPYPVVVKPVDNMGSRGCRRVDNSSDFMSALPEALKFSRSGRVIVEEYMDGPEFSVDAIVYQGEITICGLADRHIFFPPYFIEMGHTMPTYGSPETENILRVFKDGVRALGITNGAAKGDIKLSSRGPMIGEIAARLSGGYMSGWTYPYASGVEVTRGAIFAALGKKPEGLKPRKFWTCAERAFISIPGKIRSIHGLDAARNVPYVKDLFLRVGEGSTAAFPENNVSKCGNVISAAPERNEAIESAEKAARAVLIRLESPNPQTEAFLAELPSASQSFPPDAFSLPAEFYALLSGLPGMRRFLPNSQPAQDGEENADDGELIAMLKDPGTDIAVLPFPEFTQSDLRDYVGRSVEESLNAVRNLTGLSLPVSGKPMSLRRPTVFLGSLFWNAFIRGGYQGAAYLVDYYIG